MKNLRLGLATTVGLSALLCAGAALPATAADGPRGVVKGLVGPLHVSFSEGSLYIADSFAGQVVKADPTTGAKTVLAEGLNVSAVSVGTGGRVFAAIGEGGPGVTPSLVRVTPEGPKMLADLLAYEKANNPDGQPQSSRGDSLSNPYDVLALPDRTLVADAGANDILAVSNDGTIRTLTVLPVSRTGACANATNNGVPNGGCDPVPTAMATGPDGFLYVSGLGAEVEGHIWKIDQTSGRIVAQYDGFPPLTGIAVGDSGSIYVSSLFTNSIYRLSARAVIQGVVSITHPTGLTLHNGELFAGGLSFPPRSAPIGRVVNVPLTSFSPAGS